MGSPSKGKKGAWTSVGRAGLGRGIQSGQMLLELVHHCAVATREPICLLCGMIEADVT